jgi:hypothetical protein
VSGTLHQSRLGKPVSALVPLLFGILVLSLFLPMFVNYVAYVFGIGPTGMFNPVSYGRMCNKQCHTVTKGYMSGSRQPVTWGAEAPIGHPFPVRVPVWPWALETQTPNSSVVASAIGMVITGAFVLLGVVAVAFAVSVALPGRRSAAGERRRRNTRGNRGRRETGD